MPGVSYGKSRQRATEFVDLISPTGAHINVSNERAAGLLGRAPIDLPDGTKASYRYANDADEKADSKSSTGRTERSGKA